MAGEKGLTWQLREPTGTSCEWKPLKEDLAISPLFLFLVEGRTAMVLTLTVDWGVHSSALGRHNVLKELGKRIDPEVFCSWIAVFRGYREVLTWQIMGQGGTLRGHAVTSVPQGRLCGWTLHDGEFPACFGNVQWQSLVSVRTHFRDSLALLLEIYSCCLTDISLAAI